MAEQKDGKKGGQKKKEDGAQSSSQSHKARIGAYYASGRLAQKKVRHVFHSHGIEAAKKYAEEVGQLAFFRSIATDDVIAHRQVASERRRLVREARANARFDAAVARHEARRVAEAVAKATAALKAKRSAAAKKAAETRKANRLAAEAANDQVAMS